MMTNLQNLSLMFDVLWGFSKHLFMIKMWLDYYFG